MTETPETIENEREGRFRDGAAFAFVRRLGKQRVVLSVDK